MKNTSFSRLAAFAACAALALPARAQLLDYMPASAGGDIAGLQAAVLGGVDSLNDARKSPRLKFGGLTLQTYYNATETYDTNIFLAPTGGTPGALAPVRDSWIMDNNFGFKSTYDISPRHKLDLAYDFTSLSYQGNGGSSQADPNANNAIDQALSAGYTYTGPNGITAKLRDNYINTTDPADTELIQRFHRWENMVGGEMEYSPSHTAFVSVDAESQNDRYITNDPQIRALLDRVTETIGGRVGWYVAPKTKVFVAYHAQDMHFTDYTPALAGGPARDNHSDTVSVGVEGKIAPKLTARAETGYTYTSFDAPAQGTNSSISRIWSFDGGLFYKPWEKTNVDLTANRGLVPAVLGANQFYVATSGGLSITHRFPWNFTLGANGSIERDDYQSPISINGATSNVFYGNAYLGGVVASYDITSYASLTANEMYISRFSDFAAYDYIDHRTSVTLTVRY
ncbi:MAG: outer membrane beta-barrel protein [Elusimicrobia bacterium]|nr:outer membrane beta-barrel protein [Elusimicrobiota bacterium]